jgi:hypothetical protein
MFDIASAYDKIWHKGLIYKLLQRNIPKYLVAWITEFLKNRHFEVRVNQQVSSRQRIMCGVPQGAVLSPLLFSLFINDIPDNTKKNQSYSLLFADDLIYFEIHYKDSILNKNINDQLIRIQEWLDKWRLRMAVHKCNYIIFHNSNQAPNDLKLTMNNQSIKRVAEATFLGITLDEKLKFRSHIDQIKKKSTSRLNIIKILSHSSWKLSKTTLINLYNTIIRSLFEYSSILVTALDTKAIQALRYPKLGPEKHPPLTVRQRKEETYTNRQTP